MGLLLNLCGNLDKNFVSDQSGGLKEMLQQMDEVEFSSLVKQVIFPPLQRVSLGYEGLGLKVWDIIENRACTAFVHGFSKAADNV